MRRFRVQVTRVGVGPDLQPLLVVVRVQPGVERRAPGCAAVGVDVGTPRRAARCGPRPLRRSGRPRLTTARSSRGAQVPPRWRTRRRSAGRGAAGRWSTPTAGAHRRCSAARPELAGAATVCPVCGSRRTRCRTRPAVPLPGGTGRHMSRNPVSARATRSATESVYGIGASSRLNVCWSTPGTCLVSGLFQVGSCPIP